MCTSCSSIRLSSSFTCMNSLTVMPLPGHMQHITHMNSLLGMKVKRWIGLLTETAMSVQDHWIAQRNC